MKKAILIFLFGVLIQNAFAQVHCANVRIDYTDISRIEFVFDNFSKYQAGIAYYGVARIKVNVENKTPIDPDCRWMLRMSIENNPSSGALHDEWETLMTYSPTSQTPKPTIDILNVKIENGCNTPLNSGSFQNFSSHNDQIQIIENNGILIPTGSCTQGVNGPGSYYTNYDEFTFEIDLRVTPGFNYRPGVYNLELKFHLEEVI